MDYICYYDIIAAVLLFMLFALYFMRRNYPTSTYKAYLAMLLCISLSTIADLVSVYTIARADTIPLGLNYAINILYLLAYNGSAITFYYYVLTLTKPKNTKILTAITYITSLIIVTVLLPTPITHWGIYFDAQKKYQHGFLFPLLYICSLFLLVCAFFVYLQNRKKINRYQIVSILLEIDKSILWSAMENRKHLLFYVIR